MFNLDLEGFRWCES